MQLDARELKDSGIDGSTPLTLHVNGIRLKSALHLMLGNLDLAYLVLDDTLQITSKQRADSVQSVRVYPVGDLVMPVRPVWGWHPY